MGLFDYGRQWTIQESLLITRRFNSDLRIQSHVRGTLNGKLNKAGRLFESMSQYAGTGVG